MTAQLPFDRRESQNDAIIKYLSTGASLTPLKALQMFNCFRLGGRIYDLKKRGFKIQREMVKVNGARVARYRLEMPMHVNIFEEEK